jgi:hypothetical protein
MKSDNKRELRRLKKAIKRAGNKHRRQSLKQQLRENPAEAHFADEDLGGRQSRHLNALDRPVDGSD